ncbi:hypothetical protein Lbir_0228 [Legionella birminghamensis]|uniref:Coiled-coil protein n=1 Tax=Legionella birminghamensis TaxID=28083 RepID=A0A378IAF2_9GAMM|nr:MULTISPECIES: hypothetical protein [Legionella]KTC76159.1 hypothetical protein Lbir_0228 [Legionella birminghamensis]MCE3045364.1 hypothetical protein [Legionella sp. 16cNR16C]STX32217.1 Uncharacterised protein [Legionella birminghamensis]
MKLQCDSLKCVTLLEKKGASKHYARAFVELLTEMEIFNIYSDNEVNSMLSETINKIFEDRDKRFIEQKREFDESRKELKQEMLESRKELRDEILASRRWMIGTVVTIGLSLAAYLTTLIKVIH